MSNNLYADQRSSADTKKAAISKNTTTDEVKGESTLFEDQRPEAILQRKIKKLADAVQQRKPIWAYRNLIKHVEGNTPVPHSIENGSVVQGKLEWTSARLESHTSNTGGSMESYREVLASLRKYESALKLSGNDNDPSMAAALQDIIDKCKVQEKDNHEENRNLAITTLRQSAEVEIERLNSGNPQAFMISKIVTETRSAGLICRMVRGMDDAMARAILSDIRANASANPQVDLGTILARYGNAGSNNVNNNNREDSPHMYEWGIGRIKGSDMCFLLGSSGTMTNPVNWASVLKYAEPIAHSHPSRAFDHQEKVQLNAVFEGQGSLFVLPTNSDFMMPGRQGLTKHSVYTPYPCQQDTNDKKWYLYQTSAASMQNMANHLTFHFTQISRRRNNNMEDSYQTNVEIAAGNVVIGKAVVESPDTPEKNKSVINLKNFTV